MPRGRSRKARDASRARTMSLIRRWTVAAAVVVVGVLVVLALMESGRIPPLPSRGTAPKNIDDTVAELDRAVGGALVKMGVAGATSVREERTDGRHTWTHTLQRGRIPAGISTFRCNLAITRAVRSAGGRVIRAGDRGPDYRGLRTLDMRIGYGDLETHRLVLQESPRGRPTAAAGAPRIAIVIDDFGNNESEAARGIIDLEFPITVSVLPHRPYTADVAELAHAAGKEVMVHIPMQPRGYPEVDPGEGALMSDHTREEILRRTDSALDDVPYAVGANNHMGSDFTAHHIPMRVVMGELKRRGYYFLDSMTTPESVGLAEAARAGVPAERNRMFIDSPLDEMGRIDVESQLGELEDLAVKLGSAVGIGHPHPETLRVLRRMLPELERDGVELVFVSELVHREESAR